MDGFLLAPRAGSRNLYHRNRSAVMPQLRSIWKGHIRFSLVTIPIRIYNAVDTGQSVSFNQLN